MNKLVEIRSQEMICRERALRDVEHRDFWTAKAEEWEQLALDEIAYHFRECNAASFVGVAGFVNPASSASLQ